jgi:N-acetylglucosaminyldiphosphoundecaprenol N-acetyl-beta-D-mannosaminyltransferase
MRRINFLDSPMDSATLEDSVACIENGIAGNDFIQHVVVNVAKLVHMQSDEVLARSVRDCDMINIDGMGVVWGARLCGHNIPERVAGIDLFESLLQMSARCGYPVYLLGATDEVVKKTAEIIVCKHKGLQVAGYHHGYFWDNELAVVNEIKASGAKLLFVAITSPKKENFINKWRSELGVNFVMGVGGTFDVVSGKVKRAPNWMQVAGLEWLFRVIQEPRRMWWRYANTNSRYFLLVLREFVRSRLRIPTDGNFSQK